MTPSEQMQPNLRQLLDELKNDIFATFNCVQIAQVNSVKSSEQTVQATIKIRRVDELGTSTLYPILVDVPYFVLQGGGTYIDVPISADDICLILFNDRNIDNWWKTGATMNPADYRKHSLSDGIAIVGLNPATAALAMGSDALGLIGGSKYIRIKNDTDNLASILQSLISALAAIVTVGSATTQVLNAASISAINAIGTRLATLLKV